jgi:hypothetical protein
MGRGVAFFAAMKIALFKIKIELHLHYHKKNIKGRFNGKPMKQKS